VTTAAPELEEVRRRLDASRRTGSRAALWPDLPHVERVAALGRIRSVVKSKLADASAPVVLRAEAVHDARVTSVAAFTAGLGPLLGWWVERGEVEASAALRPFLTMHIEHGRRRSALLRSHTAAVVEAMQDVGVSPILLKGLHTGAEFFPHPCTRPASDVDLLVHPSSRSSARAVLTLLGYVESRRSRFAERSEWRPTGHAQVVHSLEVDHTENPWSVDLHHSLGRWYFRGVRRELGDGAFETDRFAELEGRRTRVLDQPHLTAFLALHASYDLVQLQMVRIFELVQVIRAESATGRLRWSDFQTLLDRTDTGRFVYPALRLAEELAPGTVDADLLDRLGRRASARMNRILELVRRAEMGVMSDVPLAAKLLWADGPREALLLLSDLLVPSDDGAGTAASTQLRRVRIAAHRIRTRWLRATDSGRRGEE
jgi:hypothetical protein